MHAKWQDRADFLTVYIREAHPSDAPATPKNEADGICYAQPKTIAERLAIVNDFVTRFTYTVPMVVDPIDNPTDRVYAGWPERLYVIGADGRVAYKGDWGPRVFDPEQVEAWLVANAPPAPEGLR